MENNKYHILIVEDDKEIRDGVEIYLKNQGYQVWKAANGKEGLEIVTREEIHLAILDIMMPVMDGLEATRRIRAMKRPDARTIPIIAMTANAFAEDRQLAFAAGMDMHIAKPLEGSEMVETLERFVKSSRK